MITGVTQLIAHIGYPTHTFKSPMIYNPWFESVGVDAVVVPMGCQPDDFAALIPSLFRLTNIRGALITMPHKVAAVALLDDMSPAVRVAGACNAIRRDARGRLIGDQFDGEGFVRGVQHKGRVLRGARVLVVGCGGVGSPIAASLAAAQVGAIHLVDVSRPSAESLAGRLRDNYPGLDVRISSTDPAGFDLVVNATPLGMNDGDPLPFDVTRLAPTTFVGEVVLKDEMTPLLLAAQARGCAFQRGTDMLFEMIPAYLEFFGLPVATPEQLRSVAKLAY